MACFFSDHIPLTLVRPFFRRLPPELLKAIDPVPFGKYAMQEEQGHFTEHGYISLSGDEWNHERPAEPEKKPSIRERLEQGKKECA